MVERKRIVEDLRKILGRESVEDDELTIKLYSRDAAYIEGSALAVVFPKSTDEVSALLSYAYRRDLKIYPQGSTSELVGSSTPSDDGVILSLSRMNRIKEYSVVDMYAIAEPGVRLVELNEVLAEVGYMFPIDPCIGEIGNCWRSNKLRSWGNDGPKVWDDEGCSFRPRSSASR
jgi:FAD/FMN-containing dehydrogenase